LQAIANLETETPGNLNSHDVGPTAATDVTNVINDLKLLSKLLGDADMDALACYARISDALILMREIDPSKLEKAVQDLEFEEACAESKTLISTLERLS